LLGLNAPITITKDHQSNLPVNSSYLETKIEREEGLILISVCSREGEVKTKEIKGRKESKEIFV